MNSPQFIAPLAECQEHGIDSICKIRALFHVRNHGPCHTSALAGACGVSTAAVTGLVDSLERKGLIKRNRAGSDRRIVFIELTNDGLSAVQHVERRLA